MGLYIYISGRRIACYLLSLMGSILWGIWDGMLWTVKWERNSYSERFFSLCFNVFHYDWVNLLKSNRFHKYKIYVSFERAGTNGLKRYSYGNIDMCHIICSPTLESFYLLSCVGVSSKRLPCGWCNLGKGGGAKLRHCCLLRIRYWLAINKLYSGWDCGQDLCRPVYLHICWELREFQPIMSVAGYLGTILR